MRDEDGSTTILVVDDEALIAMDIEAILTDAGYAVAGPAIDTPESLDLIETRRLDAALLDINLGHERSDAVADALLEKGVPFAFLTGHGTVEVADRHKAAPRVGKPFKPEDVLDTLAALLEREAS